MLIKSRWAAAGVILGGAIAIGSLLWQGHLELALVTLIAAAALLFV